MILITGGAGYIGSHFVDLLWKKRKDILVIDNLSRGHREAIDKDIQFEKIDLLDYEKLEFIISKYKVESIIHFAALAYVGESVNNPDIYYTNNVIGSINLLNAAKKNGVKNFVFSSTCSLYGNNSQIPISENEPLEPINPYAQSKFIIEKILQDFAKSYNINYIILRYFNAAGSEPTGKIGESHSPETHLIPLVILTALNQIEKISVFGNTYNTFDGTCIRDYIHVCDLADAHLKALELLEKKKSVNNIINLGTGKGHSVMEIINEVMKITKKNVKFEIAPKRLGDPAILTADNKKSKEVLRWQPKYNLTDIIEHTFNWYKNKKY